MQLLLFSDIHRHITRCQDLVRRAERADVVIGAGDFACQGQGLAETFAELSKISRPFLIVSGNNETPEQLQEAIRPFDNIHLLHGQALTCMGQTFYGVGGGIPVTPFGDWSFDLTEREAEGLLAGCPAGAVLITHSPPKGCVDVSSSGASLGSEAIARTILDRQPRLCVCGHIHGSAGKSARLGETPVINAGPLGCFHTL